MTIVHLTPGTGNFYCGSCMRDNALVNCLRQKGHDALLVPLYLPLVTDEPEASAGSLIFFGGVNVYLQQKSSWFRKTPRWLDRMFDSSLVLQLAARMAGMTSARDLGDVTLSMLRGEEGRQVKEIDRLVDWLRATCKPDVICLSNALLIGLVRRLKDDLQAPVVCTLQGEDSFLDALPEPAKGQCWQTLRQRAAEVDAFLAVSEYYRDAMVTQLGLARDKVHVVHNGMCLEDYRPVESPPDPPVLGYLARMCPTKGLATLVEAYILLRKRGKIADLQLRVGGTQTAQDAIFVQRLRKRLDGEGLGNDAAFLANLYRKAKIDLLRSLSVLSVPATYGESFGLYVIEALACRVPVVQPRHGAFPELLEATGGGILCEPDSVESLAEGIEYLLLHPSVARKLGERGREAVLAEFTVERMTDKILRVFDAVQ